MEKKEGKWKGDKDVIIMDLPGIYSLSPYTLEEVVARNYLIEERPDAILNIVDGSNLERNLYLTTQLTELGIPVVVAINMMDVVAKNGDMIQTERLAKELGCPVYSISALKGTGIQEAAQAVVAAAAKHATVPQHSFAPSVEGALSDILAKLPNNIPQELKRFYAIKCFERDEKIPIALRTAPGIEEIIANTEKELDDDSESIITNERYTYIGQIIQHCYQKKNKGGLTTSDKIDQIVTNRWLALPIFAIVMYIVYYISVTTIGTYVTDWTNDGLFGDGFYLFGNGRAAYEEANEAYTLETQKIDAFLAEATAEGIDISTAESDPIAFAAEAAQVTASVTITAEDESTQILPVTIQDYEIALQAEEPAVEDFGTWIPGIPVIVGNVLEKLQVADWLQGLILDGIIGGVGAVLGFVPQMLVLFIFLAFLEGCGYMARIAFIMDRIFRKFGLSGKSFIPMLIGTGCGVPGVMASRTIENDRDRKMTIMTTTFIPCGAKLPIIALIAGALFSGASWVAPSAYFVGIAAIIISGIILKKTKMFAGDPSPFVMELQTYHLPTVINILSGTWERGWSFIKKAGTIILVSSIIIWAGSCFGMVGGQFIFDAEMELESSVLGIVGNALKWIFAPLGFADIRATIATIMGLVAKEEVVGVFGVLDFEGLSQISAYSFLAFNLLCAPCFAAMGAIKREMNNIKWFWFAIGYQCVLAYIVALCIFQIGSLIIEGTFGIGTVVAFLLVIGFIYLLFRPYKESKTLDVNVKSVAGAK